MGCIGALRKMVMCNQKLFIVIVCVVVILLGLVLAKFAFGDAADHDFQEMATLVHEEAGSHVDTAIMSLGGLGVVIAVTGAVGAYGALKERKGFICCYALLGTAIGGLMCLLGATVFLTAANSYPHAVNAVNKFCIAVAAEPQAATVVCNGGAMPTAGAPAAAPSGRRLDGLPSDGEVEEAGSPGDALAAFLHYGDVPCEEKITRLCAPPAGLDVTSICMCNEGTDAGVVLTESQTGGQNEAGGAHCDHYNSLAEETCIVNSNACGGPTDSSLTVPEGFLSAGPCGDGFWGNVFPRAAGDKVGTDGLESYSAMLKNFFYKTIIISSVTNALGGTILLSVLCSCCLCCEMATGKKIEDHANTLLASDDEYGE